jgi:hypothetical protein
MLLFTDDDGRYIGHTDAEYPAPPEMLERVRKNQGEGQVWDVPPFGPEFWYFPNGVPTIRPRLDYTVSEKHEDGDRVSVISGIPSGAMVTVSGPEGIQTWEADGEDLELVLRTVGDYTVTFDPFPAQPVTIHIAVTAKGASDGAS